MCESQGIYTGVISVNIYLGLVFGKPMYTTEAIKRRGLQGGHVVRKKYCTVLGTILH